jgi:hypothetical protein
MVISHGLMGSISDYDVPVVETISERRLKSLM